MTIKLTFLTLILSISLINTQINWQNGQPTGTTWAMACDFKGNDLTNKEVDGPDCAQTCASTFGCTHFTWTNYKSFTCWMKKGSISQSNAVYTGDQLILCGIIPNSNSQIDWQSGQPTDTTWALACDFKNNDLSNQQVAGPDCAQTCASTSGCTHFTWTSYNGGTCWMKSGSISKSNALSTGDQSMVCGIYLGVRSNFII